MKILIPSRAEAPAIHLYVSILKTTDKITDRPVLLLLPGGPGGNHTVYNSLQNELIKYANLILFDPRGCGYSDESDAEYCSLDNYIEDVEALRKHFNLTKMILLGGSYGAMAAIGYAVKYAKNLDKLILLAGAPSYHFLETAKANIERKGSPEQIEAAKDLFAGTFKNSEHFNQYYKTTSSLYLFKSAHLQNNLPIVSSGMPCNINILNYGFGNFLRKFNFVPELKNITCETLILVGKEDWINDRVHAEFTAKNIPNSQLIIFNECGHFIWVDQKERFFQEIKNFLSEAEPTQSLQISI